jgi:hypothetical protein
MLEESLKRKGNGSLLANLIKVSPFQAGKNFKTETRGRLGLNVTRHWTGTMLRREQALSQHISPSPEKEG